MLTCVARVVANMIIFMPNKTEKEGEKTLQKKNSSSPKKKARFYFKGWWAIKIQKDFIFFHIGGGKFFFWSGKEHINEWWTWFILCYINSEVVFGLYIIQSMSIKWPNQRLKKKKIPKTCTSVCCGQLMQLQCICQTISE